MGIKKQTLQNFKLNYLLQIYKKSILGKITLFFFYVKEKIRGQ